jgi:hypothetical protein
MMYDIMIRYTNIMDDIIYIAYDIVPHLIDIRSNIMRYIIAYIPVLAKPLWVLPADLMARSVWKMFKNPSRVESTIISESCDSNR